MGFWAGEEMQDRKHGMDDGSLGLMVLGFWFCVVRLSFWLHEQSFE